MSRTAWRGYTLGQYFLRAAGQNALPGLMCARVYLYKRAARKKKPVQAEAKCRRCDEAPTAQRWRLKIAALVPRCCSACRHAGDSALTALSRWRHGVVALVDVGIAALRLGVAALTRNERAHGSMFFIRLGVLARDVPPTDRQTNKNLEFLRLEKTKTLAIILRIPVL
jgi:hypothetical protein